ncbi:MAG: ABC transporter permease [Simkaniaceae bacterium]|nr:ABC transporter permease [Simkaniaceae bacterium]
MEAVLDRPLEGVKESKPKRKKDTPFAIGASAIVWQLLFFYLPLVLLLVSAFFDGNGFSLRPFYPVMKLSYSMVIVNSLLFAFSTALISICIAFPVALFIERQKKRLRNFLLFLLIIPFWTNFLLHIYAWFFVLEKNGFLNLLLMKIGLINEPLGLLNSFVAVMIMMIYYFLPFAILPIYFSLERFDSTLIEASHDLGASKSQTFRKILLPMNWRAVRGAFFLVFIPAFGEFIIPELMGGNKMFFVGNVINLFVFGEATASMGTAFTVYSVAVLLVAIAGLMWIFERFPRWFCR